MRPSTSRFVQAAVVVWAIVSGVVALLPEGAGGTARVINTVVFLLAGPGVALALWGRRLFPPLLNVIIAALVSVCFLVLVSQLLLLAQVWRPWRVAVVVAVATVAVVVQRPPSSRKP